MPAPRILYEDIEILKINRPFNIGNGKKFSIYSKTKKILKKMSILQNKILNNLKKAAIVVSIASLVLLQNPLVYVLAFDIPQAPTAPSAPTAPEAPTAPTAPSAPTAPEAPSAPSAPIPPEAPSAPSYSDVTPTPEVQNDPVIDNSSSNTSSNEESLSQDTSVEGSGQDQIVDPLTLIGEGTGGQVADGEVGGATISTGDATNQGAIITDANENLASASLSSDTLSGVEISNTSNGDSSQNNGSASITNSNTVNQGNNANVTNNLGLATTTGDNSASGNTGGDNLITTGDANTTGTIITSVNTNLSGVEVYEFNIAEDTTGDYIIDFNPANCVSGCSNNQPTSLENSGNGADSTNNIGLDTVTEGETFQTNDATVENNMTLISNSGDNNTDRNTTGDNTISTGDANVSANALTFANNNLDGNIIYSIINIFGDLIGDIVLPDSALLSCCGLDTNLANTQNGDGSVNNINLDTEKNSESSQFNQANIDNNLILAVTTGDNETDKNTNGTNSVNTGDANIEANVVNIANTNIILGNWWLVLVNEGGKWIGKIIGGDGSNVYGSDGFEFVYDENGELLVSNNGNGDSSKNSVDLSTSQNNSVTQVNNANITNNINLSANTGGNSASRNVTGNNTITTGDANIVANIVNFVNNNIVGNGKLFISVVNVFGKWFGDFVGPGQTKEEDNSPSSNQTGGTGSSSSQSSSGGSSSGSNSSNSGDQTVKYLPQLIVYSIKKGLASTTTMVEGSKIENVSTSQGSDIASDKKVLNINLAWVILIIPFIFIYILRKRAALRASLAK